MERTLVLFKPDCVQRGLVGRILARFEAKGLKVIGLKMRRFPTDLIERHYAVHKERPFYRTLVDYMTSGPAVAACLEGKDAIGVTRRLMGETDARKALPGTIRGDFAMSLSNNLVHGSDGPESAEHELSLFFPGADELVPWEPAHLRWLYNVEEELE